MAIKHRIVDKTDAVTPPGMDMLNQLSGLIGMATAMMGANVSLPGIQGIGSQIAGLGPSIIAGGGAAGSATDTSGIAGVMSSLGGQLSSVTSMAGAGGILSSMTSQLGALTNMINPAGGGQSKTIHSHILDAMKGIAHSAFEGKHTVSLGQDGIGLQSQSKVETTAPKIPHNGLTSVSDALQVSKIITGSGFGIISDERLKDHIEDHPSRLEDVLKLRLKNFNIKTVNWDTGTIIDEPARPSMGLIAQEVQKIFPMLIKEDLYLTLDEGKVGMELLGAFQEFVVEARAEIAALKVEIKELKK